MTKSQIKAELRRSALEERDPFWDIGLWRFPEVRKFLDTASGEHLYSFIDDELRTFYLLVDEAL